jgi:serine/threonine protein kinase
LKVKGISLVSMLNAIEFPAVVKCSECGTAFLETANSCPSCGHVAVVLDTPTLESDVSDVTSPSPKGLQHKQGKGFPPGTVLVGRYRVIALLGRGGMGEVYRAEDLKLGNAVALKFLPHPYVTTPPLWLGSMPKCGMPA